MLKRLRIEIGASDDEVQAAAGQTSRARTFLYRGSREFLEDFTPSMLRALQAVADAPGLSARDLAARLNRGLRGLEIDLARLWARGLIVNLGGRIVLSEDEELMRVGFDLPPRAVESESGKD